MMLLLGGIIAFTGGLGAFNMSRAQTYLLSSSSKAPSTLNDPTLYTLYVLWPILASGCFLISQFVLVLRSLSARLPLVYLTLSAFFLCVGTSVHLVGSVSICRATNRIIDGALFDTIFLLLSSLSLFKFWSDITEGNRFIFTIPKIRLDDWDDFRISA